MTFRDWKEVEGGGEEGGGEEGGGEEGGGEEGGGEISDNAGGNSGTPGFKPRDEHNYYIPKN